MDHLADPTNSRTVQCVETALLTSIEKAIAVTDSGFNTDDGHTSLNLNNAAGFRYPTPFSGALAVLDARNSGGRWRSDRDRCGVSVERFPAASTKRGSIHITAHSESEMRPISVSELPPEVLEPILLSLPPTDILKMREVHHPYCISIHR